MPVPLHHQLFPQLVPQLVPQCHRLVPQLVPLPVQDPLRVPLLLLLTVYMCMCVCVCIHGRLHVDTRLYKSALFTVSAATAAGTSSEFTGMRIQLKKQLPAGKKITDMQMSRFYMRIVYRHKSCTTHGFSRVDALIISVVLVYETRMSEDLCALGDKVAWTRSVL